jgi:TRAP-type C4-dicarboxylate transport system permease small subunit
VLEVAVFLMAEVVMMGALMAVQKAEALAAALDWFSLAAPTWSGCLRILPGAFPFLAVRETLLFHREFST